MIHVMRHTLLLFLLILPACDDDTDPVGADSAASMDLGMGSDGPVDASIQVDSARPDGAVDATPDGAELAPDADIDAAGDPPDAQGADLGVPQNECDDSAECVGFARCVAGECVPPGPSPLSAVIVLNEILIDGAIDVDANGDGDVSGVDDEFIELLNIGPMPVPLGGITLVESDILGLPRHTFADDFVLDAGHAVVLFGGGNPSEVLEMIPNVDVLVVNAQDPAFSNGLNLDDAGDTLRLLDTHGDEIFTFAYGNDCRIEDCPVAMPDQSLTRSPDGAGAFTPHTDTGHGLISPGTRADGTPFGG